MVWVLDTANVILSAIPILTFDVVRQLRSRRVARDGEEADSRAQQWQRRAVAHRSLLTVQPAIVRLRPGCCSIDGYLVLHAAFASPGRSFPLRPVVGSGCTDDP